MNGVAAVPIMVMIMLLACRNNITGQFTLTRWLTGLVYGQLGRSTGADLKYYLYHPYTIHQDGVWMEK